MGDPGERFGSEVADRGRRLFEFLAAAQRLRLDPVRTVDSYERDGSVLWWADLPVHPAVQVATTEAAPPADAPLLVVHRVLSVDAPSPPASVEPWLDGTHLDPQSPPALRATRTLVTDDGPPEGETVRFEDLPDLEQAYAGWRATWDAWAATELTDRPARTLYKSLFGTWQTATSQSEELELVLAVGCLAWAPEGHDRVRRHLFTTPAAVVFDEATGTLTVTAEPSLDSLTVELDMLDPALLPAAELLNDVTARARAHDAHPLDREATGELVRRLVFTLDPDARYDDIDDKPSPLAVPLARFAPALVLRKRSRLGLVAVFERIAAAIAAAGEVPTGLLPLIDPDHRPVVEADPTPGAMVDVDDEIFLPLPLNDAQLDIIRRVDHQAQTLVQGPPGTGKTHLAAALISHLLAQGKRVLVTAHTDRALKEVRSKLPEEIKPLAVAVVGSDRSDLADLKVAVERISARSSDADPEALDAQARTAIDDALAGIDELRRRRADLRTRLLDARVGDVTERSFAGCTGTFAALARTYTEQRDEFGWILAHTSPDVAIVPPLTGDEAARWLALLRDSDVSADEEEARLHLLDLAALPTPDQFAALLDDEANGAAGFAAVRQWAQHPAFDAVWALAPDVRGDLQQRMTDLARQITAFEQRREQWMAQALYDLRTGRGATWSGRDAQIHQLLSGAWNGLQQLPQASKVTIADGADRSVIASLAQYLLEHVRANGPVKVNPDGTVKLGTFAARALKNSKTLFDVVRVDGRQPTSAEHLTLVLVHLDVERHLDALDQAWPADVQIPAEDTPHERFQWHATEHQLLRGLLAVGQQLAVEQQRFDTLGLPHPDWSDLDAVLAYAWLVDAASARDTHAAATTPLEQLATTTAAAAAWSGASPVCGSLDDAVRRRDRDAYARGWNQVRWLRAVRELAAERDALTGRVAAAAPALAHAVRTSVHDDVWTRRLPALAAAWDWARLGVWVLGQETVDANELQQQLDVADDALRGVIEKLAATRAWRHALGPTRLTGQARADLNLYARLVRRLGKGTGKYAAAQRAEIRAAMDECRPAVPVWIMPIYRIAEQVHVTENMFDVVIVDEASQAGVEATFLQYLAPKIVVIGDDKQVSPSAVGVDQQRLRDLAGQYLADNRYKATWQDPKLSLFDAASIWYGSKRTLVEHRRCVPEIIAFSNRIAYEPDNIRLVPVRQFGSDRLDPVKVVRVLDGYETGSTQKVNRPEAEAIVAQLEKCIADPRYDGKSFGVVSLLGPRQAKVINDLLLERVPPQEWTARDLRCGDAAAFQGSERDVMFLSMVSAPEPGQRMGSLTVEANVQRYNVAASRAKDQMWVFHTVGLDQLTNPEDMRFQLLDYCYHGVHGLRVDDTGSLAGLVPEDRRVAPFDSLFEQRVHNRIVERGYTVLPQVDALGYRIDLVVVGGKGRLAVECDGDYWHGPEAYLRDLARERDLRRCGWQFFRIKEAAFYVDQHAALSQLWATLDELEIRPAGWSDVVESDDAAASGEDVADVADVADGQHDETVPTEPDEPQDGPGLAADDPAERDLDDDRYFPDPVARWEPAPASRTASMSRRPAPRPAPRLDDAGDLVAPRTTPTASSVVPARRADGGLLPYEAYTGWAPSATDASRDQVALVLRDIVSVEGPVLGFRLHTAYVNASGVQRAGRLIQESLNRALVDLTRRGVLLADDPLGRAGMRSRTFRLPDQLPVVQRELGPRDLDEVPPRELAALVRDAADVTGWDSTENLFREALRRLGRVRLTTGVTQTLSAVLPLLAEPDVDGADRDVRGVVALGADDVEASDASPR